MQAPLALTALTAPSVGLLREPQVHPTQHSVGDGGGAPFLKQGDFFLGLVDHIINKGRLRFDLHRDRLLLRKRCLGTRKRDRSSQVSAPLVELGSDSNYFRVNLTSKNSTSERRAAPRSSLIRLKKVSLARVLARELHAGG